MTRFSLNNRFFAVSHQQFQNYTQEFKDVAHLSFGVKCKMNITLLNQTKMYTSFADDRIQSILDRTNEAALIAKFNKLEDITLPLWKEAKYVEVQIRPTKLGKATKNAFAYIEFKGERPRQASFYIQGTNDEVVKKLIYKHFPGKKIGDGRTSNSKMSEMIPFSYMIP